MDKESLCAAVLMLSALTMQTSAPMQTYTALRTYFGSASPSVPLATAQMPIAALREKEIRLPYRNALPSGQRYRDQLF